MADEDVVIGFVGQDKGLEQQWRNVAKWPKNMADAMQGLNQKTQETGNSFTQMAAKIAAGFTAASIAQKALNIAINEGTRGYQQMLQNQRDSGNFHVSLATAQRAALRNLGEGEVGSKALIGRLGSIAKNTGADLTAVTQAASGILSARGNMSQTQALNQLEAVAKIDPSMMPQELQAMAGATMDIRKNFGGTAEQAIGAMLRSQMTARVENTADFAQNVVPAIVGLGGFGTDYRSASALVSAISQKSADVQGRRSGTAAIQLAKIVNNKTAGVKDLIGKGTTERIDWLLSPSGERMRKQLLGNLDVEAQKSGLTKGGELTGEAKQFIAMKELLEPGSSTRKMYEAAYADTPNIEGAESVYQQNLDIQKGITAQQTMSAAETFRASDQKLLSGPQGTTGKVREGLQTMLGRMNYRGYRVPFQESYEMKLFDANVARGEDPRNEAARVLSTRFRVATGRLANSPGSIEGIQTDDAVLQEVRELIRVLRAQAENGIVVKDVLANGAAQQANNTLPNTPPVGALQGAGR